MLHTGSRNVAVGEGAGDALTSANDNTFVGKGSGSLITTGSDNTIIGRYTGNQGGLDIRTSSNHIVLSDEVTVIHGVSLIPMVFYWSVKRLVVEALLVFR